MKQINFKDLCQFQPKQIVALETLLDPKCKYLLYGGAAYGGKSYFLRWAAIYLGLYYSQKYNLKRVPIGLFSEDYPTLRDRQIIKFKQEIPSWLGEVKDSRDEGYVFKARPEYGEFLILLRNLDDPAKYSSVEFAAILVEELTKNKAETFDDLRFRLRYPQIEDVKFAAATNPGSIGHGWVRQKWINPPSTNLDIEQDRFFFVPSKFSDNRYATADYVKQLDSLPERKREAYKEGNWDIFEGQFFMGWNSELHVINSFVPSKKNTVIAGGMDWGRVDNFSFHLTEIQRIDHDGGHFFRSRVFLEVYGKEHTPAEWTKIIRGEMNKFGLRLSDVQWVQGDTQMWNVMSTDARSLDIYTQFTHADSEWRRLRKANKDRIGGWENLQRWLSIAPDGLPYLQFTRNCPNAARLIPELVHDENKREDVDERGENDAADSVRYLHMALKWIDGGPVGAFGFKNKPKPLRTAVMTPDGRELSIDTEKFAEVAERQYRKKLLGI